METHDSKPYLVTGCAGFIAAQVAHQLLDAGHQVFGIDNLNDYYDVSLKQFRLDQLNQRDGFEFRLMDLADREAVDQLFEEHEFEAVLNLAARAGVRYSLANPYVYMATNATGNLHLLEQMQRKSITKYVLASTSSLYAGQRLPFVESLPVNTPLSPYAATKKAAEVMAYSYHHLYGIDVSVVRYFTVYGPAGRPDMSYFRFIRWIDEEQPIELFGDGTQSRDFTYVDDIARGTVAAAMADVGYEVINLGGGNQPISINTMIEILENLLGKKAHINYQPFHIADMESTWADIEKANRLLNWKPTVSLEEGLAKCVQWYRDHKPWSQQIKLP